MRFRRQTFDNFGNFVNGVNNAVGNVLPDPCESRDPTWDEYLDFDRDCNRKIEVMGGLDAVVIWTIIGFLVFILPFIICFFKCICLKK